MENCLQAVKDNIAKVLVGQERVTSLLLAALLAGGHVLLEDVPGMGKTVMARALAKSLDADFGRVQFTPDLLPTDVTGLNFFHQQKGEFVFNPGPVFCNILLADEINRATPRTQSSLLECMAEGQVTVDGVTRKLPPPFFVIATQNPVETAGTYPLPEAQLDRFLMEISMGYPDKPEELAILDRFGCGDPLKELGPVCRIGDLMDLRQKALRIYVHPLLKDYMVDLVQATRKDNRILNGASPRGTLSLYRAVRAHALIQGRDYVVPEDIKTLAVPVLAHRLTTARTFGLQSSAREIMSQLLSAVPLPTEDWRQGV